ncbi:uncharacterized protein LOC129961958 [Argiope bruennichi]|uniref:uncharacterized protein LOC129961958 n=1 Tax=Argiope bruennichi TaxID=94029 RepID=UPI0024954AC1|nr:uncharacterized protein LOC129961958 [Argiope bruennichi]
MSLKKRNTTSKGKRDNFEEEMLLAKDCRVLVEKLPESELLNLEDKTTKTASGKEKEELERHSPSTSKGRRINASSTESASPIRSSLRQRKTVVNKADSKEKEMPFTKHCHVLLERLSESQLREETMEIEVRKKREEEVEYHLPSISKGDSEIVNAPSNQNASLLEALTKQGETTMNKTDSEAHISRKFRRSRQENKRRKQKHRPCYTQRHVSKLKNDSTMELSEQEDRAPEEEDSSKFKEERPNGALLIRFKKGEATSIKDKSGFCLGHHFYFNAFRKYLIALRGIERSNILYELLQRDLKQELILQNAHDLQYDVNKKLVEWIAKSALKVKEVSLEGQWEMIKRAAMEAEQSVIDEIRKSYENRMMRKRKVQADESSNQEKVLKLPIPNLIDEKVKAAKSIKENASISVKEITNEKEHIQISSKGKGSETPILEKEISNTDPNQSEISTSERECKISTNLQSSNMTLQKDITKKFSENHDTNKNVNATNLLVDEVSVSNKIEEIVKNLKKKAETQKSSNEFGVDTNAAKILADEVPASNKTEEIVKNLKKKDETQESSNEFGVDTNTTNLLADEVPESNKTEEIVKNLKKKDETQKSWNEVGFDTNTTNLLVDEESESNKTEEIVKNLKKKDETQESSNEFGVDTNTTDLLVNEVPESNKTEEIVKNLKKKDETQKSSNEFGVDTNTTNLLVYEVSVSNKIEEIVKNLKKKAKTQESSNEFGVDTNAAKILADEVPASNKTEEIVKNLKKKDETQESSNEFGVDTNSTDLLVNEVPESNKTEEIVKNLKKKDETQKSSNEFGVDTNTTNLLADEVPESNKTEEIVKNLKKKDETQKSWNEVGFDTNTTNLLVDEESESNKTEEIVKNLKKKDETQESSNEFGVDTNTTDLLVNEVPESNKTEEIVKNLKKKDETQKSSNEFGVDTNTTNLLADEVPESNKTEEIVKNLKKKDETQKSLNEVGFHTNTTNLLVDEESESNKTEEIVKNLKKKDETQKSSNEFGVDTNAANLLADEVLASNKTEEIVKNLKKKNETQESSNEFGVDTNAANLLADEVPASNKTEEIVKNLKKKDETQESSNEFGVDAYLEVSEQHVNFGSGQKHNTISFLDDSSDTDTYVIIDEESESNASEISVNNFEKDDETAKLPSECGNHIDLNGNEQQEISCSKQTSSSEDARFINLEVETPETTVKSLKKYHNTQKHSSEYDVDLKIQQETNEQQESLCESVRNTVSSIECMPANERNTEGSDNIQEISFGEHSEIKQKTILASDIEKKTFSETEIIISNDRSVSLHAENKMSAISSEIWISDFEKTADAKSGHTPSEKSAIERLLEECIQLVENQDLTPSREPNEISLAKTEKNYGVAFSCSISDTGSNHSNAQERDCSSTKNTTGLNPLPVSTNDIQLLNSSENVTSATEECIQLVENQDLIPSREPSEVSVAKTQNNDGVAFSCSISDTGSNHRNAQERNCSSTKNTTDLNPLPVSTNDIPLLNNATENVASATETKTFYEAHLSSNIGSVPGSPQKSGDSSLGEINIHENVLNVYSSIYNKLVGWIPETSARVIATEMSSNVASPNLTSYHESVHTTSEEKNNSSPAITASSLGERRNSESESESDDNLSKEYCDGQGCVSCAIIVRAKAKEAFQSFKPLPLSEIPAPKTRRRRTYLQRLMNRK